jgi:predicted nucleotide-binding protein
VAIILFAENDMNFLKTRREFLEREGHIIISATTPAEAWEQLKRDQIDLAILDIRLINDDDEKDISGLNLAKDSAFRSVPKIMLTGFPSVQAVRETLGPELDGLPSAMDFIAKQEGPKVLADAVRKVLKAVPTRVQDVFVVHGHDSEMLETVARFIEHLGLRPIILRDQPLSGRTIIAQLEHFSRVGFAIVLLTPDDVGYSKSQPDQYKGRARQNVIFELGFFIGKLGRSKVCSIYVDGVEILSDYQGVLYIPMDPNGAWKMRLARELEDAGLKIHHKNVY